MKPISPIVAPEFKALVRQGCEYLTAREAELRNHYGLGSYQRYDWDQDKGTIIFSNRGIPGVVANIHFVGSVSTQTKTWLWSWANQSVSCKVSDRILKVKEYGDRHRMPHLTQPYWAADEVDGWEMTSISAFLLSAEGGYRTPDDKGFTYMILTQVHRV